MSPTSILLVLDEDRTDVDVTKTERVLKHPRRAQMPWPEVRPPWPGEPHFDQPLVAVDDAYGGASYGVFSYQGKTYLDLWWFVHPEYWVTDHEKRDVVHVYLTEGDASEEIFTVRQLRSASVN
jgi:hypothetical protein